MSLEHLLVQSAQSRKRTRQEERRASSGQIWGNVSKGNNGMIGENYDPLDKMPQVYTAINKQMGNKVELFLTVETQLINSEGVME